MGPKLTAEVEAYAKLSDKDREAHGCVCKAIAYLKADGFPISCASCRVKGKAKAEVR